MGCKSAKSGSKLAKFYRQIVQLRLNLKRHHLGLNLGLSWLTSIGLRGNIYRT